MIHFFRDILDGPLYIVVVVFAVIFIMAIIGFLMERKQLEKKKKEGIAVVNSDIPPITPVTVEEEAIVQTPVEEQPVIQIIDEPVVLQEPNPVDIDETRN